MSKFYIFAFVVIFSITSVFSQGYSGGNGSEIEPYLIATKADLKYLSEHPNDWNKYFKQTSDIYFDTLDFTSNGDFYNNGKGFTPIGNIIDKFKGNYDGNNKAIYNIFINHPDTNYIGLFGYTVNAKIINLRLYNVRVKGRNFVGGLVGYNSYSYISKVSVTGDIQGVIGTGGLAGSNSFNSIVTESYASCNISCENSGAGGLIGINFDSSSVSSSFSNSKINGNSQVGGLVGLNNLYSKISKCFANTDVKGKTYVGGLVGKNQNYSEINDCYSFSDVTRINSNDITIGGFCGYNSDSAKINTCYSKGKVYSSPGVIWNENGAKNKGFIGFNMNGLFDNNYFDKESSEQNTAIGATGKTTTEMKTASTFVGWNFSRVWVISSPITYEGYPTLRWTGGFAIAPSSNQISSVPNLIWIAEISSRWSGNYIQTADIDMWASPSWKNNSGFTSIGNLSTKFTGSYNGQNYSILNVFINLISANYVGIFGYLNGATISNIKAEVDITGNSMVGGIAGYSYNSQINNCYVKGKIGKSWYIGGIVGYNENSNIENCIAICEVNGHYAVGGLVGINKSNANITSCYSSSKVVGNSGVGGFAGISKDTANISKAFSDGDVQGVLDVGGFVGVAANLAYINNCYSLANVTRKSENNTSFGGFCGKNENGNIAFCYSVGAVFSAPGVIWNEGNIKNKGFAGFSAEGRFKNNFFDKFSSKQDTSIGADAKNTSQMKQKLTFITQGWDFTSVWDIQSAEWISYPFLRSIIYDQPESIDKLNPIPGLEKNCANPTNGGLIGNARTICPNSVPQQLVSISPASGAFGGQIVYKWQKSTTSGTEGFSDIANSNDANFSPGALNTDTWFRRLAIVSCSGDWNSAAISNAIKISVIDNQSPIPDVPNLPNITAECSVNELPIPTATDNCSGKIYGTHNATLPITTQGQTLVNWVYDDGNGNRTTQTQHVIINDITKPIIVCPNNKTINLGIGQNKYIIQDNEFDPVSVSDNCGIASLINDYNNSSTLKGAEFYPDTKTVNWKVTDIAGNQNICSFVVTVIEYTSVQEISKEGIFIYPNPTYDYVNFELRSKIVSKVCILDIKGKTIDELIINNHHGKIDLTLYNSGAYFLKLYTNEGIYTIKIAKQ